MKNCPYCTIAEGWNPDKLTLAQVGEGWRLLDGDEIKPRDTEFDGSRKTSTIEVWDRSAKQWQHRALGQSLYSTYRTRLSRSDLAALDNPKPSWSLSRHLSGFRALRDGEEWHRLNGWKPEMIWPGWRPKLMGEEVLPGDVSFDGDFQHIFKNACGKANEMDNPTITKRPLPEPPTPRELTKEDLEEVDGLRFKTEQGSILYPSSIGEDAIYFPSHHSYTFEEIRELGWLYRGHRFGWRKCEKEGK